MYRGYFLNLQRNEQRRNALVQHLTEIGAAERYERFAAVDGRAEAPGHPTKLDPGNLGLWLSHERLLKAAATDKHVHILEDDAIMSRQAVELLDGLLAHMEQNNTAWDLLFTDIFVHPRTDPFLTFYEKMKQFSQTQSYGILDLVKIPFACTSSVLFNKASIGKYLGLMTGKWSVGIPIDLYIGKLVHSSQLKAFVTMPFITSISADSNTSDIRGDLDRSRRVCDVLRRGFFQEANIPQLISEMQELTAGAKISPLVNLYLNAEMFRLSDAFQSF
jgi:GR25 family glycosyltransferase involved in LPS biosynthesis